jgi:uncharacterized protein
MPLSEKLLNILVCPACHGPLEYRAKEHTLVCAKCALAYPVTDDVPVLLKDEAKKLA